MRGPMGFSDDPSLDPGQVAQKSVGMTDINRFGYASNPYLFQGVSTFQVLTASKQVAQDGTTNGAPVVIDNASEVFSGQIQDPTATSTCYWSPFDWESQAVAGALATGQTGWPQGLNPNTGALGPVLDPKCFAVCTQYNSQNQCVQYNYSGAQIVLRTSMPYNTVSGKTNSPAFLFERARPAGTNVPSVIQVP